VNVEADQLPFELKLLNGVHVKCKPCNDLACVP
jgi:hypothetical protein